MERVTQSLGALPAVKWIFDPSFHYTPSYATDVRKTFERIRREMQPAPSKGAAEKVRFLHQTR
jgi:hypothetical protein